jgi:hypothetical protein
MSGPNATSTSTVDITPLRAAADRINELVDAGWDARDTPPTIHLAKSNMSEPRAALDLLDSMGNALVEVRVVGTRSGQTIALRRVGTSYEVVELPEVRPEDLFDDESNLRRAAQAWDRDSDAALDLPFVWRIAADLGLERLLSPASWIEVRVSRLAASVSELFTDAPLCKLDSLTPALGMRRVYIAFDAPLAPLHLGSITFAGLASDVSESSTTPVRLAAPDPAVPLPGEGASSPLAPTGLPLPVALLPTDDTETAETWRPVRARCEALAALLVWVMIASDVTVTEGSFHLEFRGFKRVTVDLPAPAVLNPQAASGAIRMRAWAFHDASPDRLLAVRQVVSLYQDSEALWHSDDVLESAEVVYAGLRTEAVAEVIRSTREAQGQILDAVRQSLKGVQDLAKSATERLLAALVGIAAVLVANANDTLSDRAGRNLMLGVAVFLAVLALVAIVLEGPLLSLPLDNLDGDLRSGTPMLTEEQRMQLVRLPSVAATRRRVRALRVIVPLLHLTLGLLVVLFGYPAKYH